LQEPLSSPKNKDPKHDSKNVIKVFFCWYLFELCLPLPQHLRSHQNYADEWKKLISEKQPGLFEDLPEREKKRQYAILELVDSWKMFSMELTKIDQVVFFQSFSLDIQFL